MTTIVAFLVILYLFPISRAFDVETGADVFVKHHLHLIEGKQVGVVTNHTAILSDARHLVDVLHSYEKINLVKLFAPEHGIRGDLDTPVTDTVDSITNLPVISLYGHTQKPTSEMFEDLDVVLFDLQNVGARFYTYISTLYYVLDAAAKYDKPVIVLDRPNPINADKAEGNILDLKFQSFIGIHALPVMYGMTIGELALLFNGEGWLTTDKKADLTVISLNNYRRSMWLDETGLQWIKPSPNMLTPKTATVYPATCFLEGTNVSEGRGTEHPFEWIGAPWIDGVKLSKKLNKYNLPGIQFEPVSFTPSEIIDGIKIHPPKYLGVSCSGVQLIIQNRDEFQPVRTGVYILYALLQSYPDKFQWEKRRVDELWGTDRIRIMLTEGHHPEEIIKSWQEELETFLAIRSKYLLYE